MDPEIAVELKRELKRLNKETKQILKDAKSENFPPELLDRFKIVQGNLQFLAGRLGNHIQSQRFEFMRYAEIMLEKRY